ncbi:YezD family protein [Candidatus Binatus sp.]|uniref:YezD family protein n=1 Tax=Candidatus Binatus sp. TaxID=2811406 RepID=UPI00351CD5F3
MKIESSPTSIASNSSVPESHEQILERIAHAISGVRFGSVEVVIQDSKVVQIERKEKFRFDRGGGR